MDSTIQEIRNLLDNLERLLTRFELDVASRLYPLDYSQAITVLCQDFERHVQSLAMNSVDATPSMQSDKNQ
jgi:hypothetical protein